MPRYRFDDFLLSPRRRTLLRGATEQPLIPRYFDLLVFLVEHRHEAVHRRDIFDKVWRDVVVSDSALSQAVRTLRRVLGDDSREPRFIGTVSRHGYRFVCVDVVEEDDAAERPSAGPVVVAPTGVAPGPDTPVADVPPPVDPFESLLARLTATGTAEDAQREAAELLHGLGTSEALRRLETVPSHAAARALLRDTRWEAPGAGPVPILGAPSPLATAWALATLRGRRAARLIARRWASAALGAGIAGLVGGAIGGAALVLVPGSGAPAAVVPVLALIGLGCGSTAGAGVGAGMAVAEALARSRRALLMLAGGAAGGALVGNIIQWSSRWSLATLVGIHVPVGGGLDGLVLGAAAGLAYAGATGPPLGGLAAPRGLERLGVAAVVGLACGVAALALSLGGRPLVGGTIHAIANASTGSQMMLTPLARLIGEPDFGTVTGAIIGLGEGLFFGAGLTVGLTRRPRVD